MKKNILIIASLSALFMACNKSVNNNNPFKQGYKNIVSAQTLFKSSQPSFSKSEDLDKVFDTNVNTKYLVAHPTNTVTIENKTLSTIKKYTITSANDAPGRDPKNWVFSGSADGVTWHVLDTKNNEKFNKRGATNTYLLNNNTANYRFYKFDFEHAHTSVYGDNYLQIAEIELIAFTNLPVSEFTVNTNRGKINDTIYFKDNSANAPESWYWVFENGTPNTSTLQNPSVVYNTPGNHHVKLITKNKYGTDTLLVKRKIKVYNPNQPWQGFYYPEITLTHTDTTSQGYKRAQAIIPDIKKAINEVTLGVCKQLYKNISEVPDFEKVNFTYNWSNVLAARGGNASAMELWFSTKYIENALKNEPDTAVKYEIYGVLWHELTHGYQFSPSTENNQYKPGFDYFAFLEGEADLVRINAGYHKTRHPDLGFDNYKYLSGYTTSGFFLKWIADTYDNDFIYKFNASVKTIKPWSYKAAIKDIINKDVDSLWKTYKIHVNNYNKTNKPVKKKRIDWTSM